MGEELNGALSSRPVQTKLCSSPVLPIPFPADFLPEELQQEISRPRGARELIFPKTREGRHEVAGRLENSQGNYLVFPFPIELA